jgi:hypothetical protein
LSHETLNEHRFTTNSKVGSPFIESYLESNLSVGQTVDLKIPPVIIDSQEVIQFRGDLVFTGLELEFQQAIRDWMAFKVRLSVIGRLGTKAGTLLSQGVNLAGGYEFAWLLKLVKTKKFVLSGSANIFNTSITVIDLQSFVENAIDSHRITKSNHLVVTTPITTAGTALNCAYAFNKAYGFTGNLNFRYGESAKRNSNKDDWFFEYGAAFDADLKPGTKVPIGFLVGFYHHSLSISSDELTNEPNDILFQINYTGRRDLSLGLEGSYQFYKPEGFEQSIKLVNMNFNMRYFF